MTNINQIVNDLKRDEDASWFRIAIKLKEKKFTADQVYKALLQAKCKVQRIHFKNRQVLRILSPSKDLVSTTVMFFSGHLDADLTWQ